MPAFRSIRLWYLVVFLFALLATGCATSGGEKVKRLIPHLYGTEDPQFSRTMGTLLGMGILEGNQVDVLLNGDEIFPAMLQAIRSAKKLSHSKPTSIGPARSAVNFRRPCRTCSCWRQGSYPARLDRQQQDGRVSTLINGAGRSPGAEIS